jgi:hypothetical protein
MCVRRFKDYTTPCVSNETPVFGPVEKVGIAASLTGILREEYEHASTCAQYDLLASVMEHLVFPGRFRNGIFARRLGGVDLGNCGTAILGRRCVVLYRLTGFVRVNGTLRYTGAGVKP